MDKKWVKYVLIILSIIILIISLNIKNETKLPGGIAYSLDRIAASIDKRDERGFLSYIDQNNNEFYAEEKHWYQDIEIAGINGFKMSANKVRTLSEGEYIVSVRQDYMQGGKKKSINYDAVFKLDDGVYKFNDLYFKTLEKNHFIIKYQPSLEKQAIKLAGFIDEVHGNVKNLYGKAPEDKTIIKLYEDNEVFNAFIKPSIQFNMAGWYEYPESIKTNLSSRMLRFLPESVFKEHYFTVLSHELTHRINSMESNNNIPYWLAEGIATYVENSGKPNLDLKAMSIKELEKINLEALTDAGEINAYYQNSYANTSFMIKKYGLEGLHRVLEELGKYPLEESTQGVVYLKSNDRFHQVVSKLYKVAPDELDSVIRR